LSSFGTKISHVSSFFLSHGGLAIYSSEILRVTYQVTTHPSAGLPRAAAYA